MDRRVFDIQPIGRFYGTGTSIRRPKVCLTSFFSLAVATGIQAQSNILPGDRLLFI